MIIIIKLNANDENYNGAKELVAFSQQRKCSSRERLFLAQVECACVETFKDCRA